MVNSYFKAGGKRRGVRWRRLIPGAGLPARARSGKTRSASDSEAVLFTDGREGRAAEWREDENLVRGRASIWGQISGGGGDGLGW